MPDLPVRFGLLKIPLAPHDDHTSFRVQHLMLIGDLFELLEMIPSVEITDGKPLGSSIIEAAVFADLVTALIGVSCRCCCCCCCCCPADGCEEQWRRNETNQ